MNKTKLNKKKHACSLGPEGGRKRAGHPRVIMLLPPTGGSLEDLGSLGRLWEWGLGWKGGLGEGPMGLERPKGTSTHKESAPFYSTNLNSSKTKTKKQKQKTQQMKWRNKECPKSKTVKFGLCFPYISVRTKTQTFYDQIVSCASVRISTTRLRMCTCVCQLPSLKGGRGYQTVPNFYHAPSS